MSAGKGKRGADGPLAATSSSSGSSDEDSPRRPPVSFQESALEPQLEQDSVTAVFPIAVGVGKLLTKGGLMSTSRIGQIQHQDVRKPKLKKKRADLTVGDLEMTKATLQPATPRSRPPRDPLPMRMRALPQSFWQQPNRPHNVSPATIYPVLPPLVTREGEDVSDLRPVTPPDEQSEDERDTTKDKMSRGTATAAAAAAAAAGMSLSKTMPARSDRHHHRQPERSITVSNTELLSKLFEVIEKDGKKANQNPPIRKSRQRKGTLLATAAAGTNFLSGRDPYMIDSIADKLFPQLSLENSRSYASYCGNTRLQLLTLKDGDKIVTLPSLTIDQQNYPQMLSELVTHI